MKKTILIMALMLLTFNVAAQQTQNVNVELKKTEPVPLQSSEYADIWLEVTNDGTTAARNVDVTFAENYPFTVDPDEQTSWNINELTPGEEYQIHLQTRVDENAVQGDNTLNFNVRYSGTTIQQKVPVEVRSDNNILSVENIEFPETIAPGNRGEMSITLRNLADAQLKNIEVDLDLSSNNLPFATSKSSTKNIESIDSGQNDTVSFMINVDESAENGVYRLPIDLSYENEAGTGFEQSTTSGVVIGGRPSLEVGVNNENQITAGSTETVTLRVVNRGYGSANFVQMSMDSTDDFQILSPSTVYLGDMDSDDFQTAEYRIHVDQNASDLSLPIQLSYSDRDGEQVEEQQVEMQIYTQQELQQLGLTPGGSMVPLAVGAVIVLAIVFYLWRRRRKK